MLTRRDFLKVTAAGSAFALMGSFRNAKATVAPVLPDADYCLEGGRKIPVIADVDLVVAGGGARAVAAAVAASKLGCSVFLVAYMPYLGDEICGSYLYERTDGEQPQTALARKIFAGKDYPTPLHVKKTLEDELIDNKVQFLYSSYVTNAVVDAAGMPAGIVLTNRSGRQAVRCKAVIDATHEASVAAMCGVGKTKFKPGEQEFFYTVVGNQPKSAEGIVKAEVLPLPLKVKDKEHPVVRYTYKADRKDDTYAAVSRIEQQVRGLVWDAEQVDSSDLLWYVPQQTIKSVAAYEGSSASPRKISETAFHADGVRNVWVLGPCAEISREVAAKVMRPIPAMMIGEIVGTKAAEYCKGVKLQEKSSVLPVKANAFDYGQVKEVLSPLRPALTRAYIDSPAGALPVLGSYDVVVMGGGTAGASAGLTAAKNGASTLVLEYLHGLGGLSTLGMIGVYWDGFREGYTAQIDKAVKAMAPADHPRQLKREEHFVSDWKIEWYRSQLAEAGGELWYGVLGCGAIVDGNQVKGLVVATPYGRGVVLAKIVIDSTGSADVAIAAGAGFDYTGKKTLAVQGAGTGKWAPGDHYNNNDWLFVDDSDILDVSRAFVQAKTKLKGQFDMVKMPQTRERRRVVGDYTISVYDVINHRRYPDTISYHRSSFDTHGMIIDPLFILNPPEKRHAIYDADVPLRCLLPKGLEGILVTGLGASAHRDAMPVIRMQPCLQNQGYAVGYLSALCVKEGKNPRNADIKKVQRHLVKIGNLPERVLTDKEFTGFSNAEMKKALAQVTDNYKGLEILLTDTEKCKDLVSGRIRKATGQDKVILASILCMLGDRRYSDVLKEAVKSYAEWDEGWHYTGMGQFGMCLSRLDALITALGKSGDLSALPVILEKAKQLEPEDHFSHFRAVAMAAESIGDKKSAEVLAEMLAKPGVRFHSMNTYEEARSKAVPDLNDTSTRNAALKELHIARALYMCGDRNGMAEEVLKRYRDGLQGHYARYAYEILNDE